MGVLGVNPSVQMAILVSSFQVGDNNSMISESLDKYVLAYSEEFY